MEEIGRARYKLKVRNGGVTNTIQRIRKDNSPNLTDNSGQQSGQRKIQSTLRYKVNRGGATRSNNNIMLNRIIPIIVIYITLL